MYSIPIAIVAIISVFFILRDLDHIEWLQMRVVGIIRMECANRGKFLVLKEPSLFWIWRHKNLQPSTLADMWLKENHINLF